MKAICKRSYPYETEQDIRTYYQLFIKGKSYEYENTYPKISDKIEEWYFVKNDELDATETFNQIDFETFFISEKELRKIKLETLANEQDIQRIIYGE